MNKNEDFNEEEDSDKSSDTDEEASDDDNKETQPTIRSSSRANVGAAESKCEPSMKDQSYVQCEPEGEQELVSKTMAKTIEKLCFVETVTQWKLECKFTQCECIQQVS